ncbi:hypothetical protein EOD39_10912 [Acipenser ruthenus]|uniref:Uncharacterized protein n=1 Tax=Acipenser ruthenus TaxID=7906 RepID=A0A444TWQ5_ACIRT|nr:hypothetical protein EOD39_10912 [Acipenser ruthenus]
MQMSFENLALDEIQQEEKARFGELWSRDNGKGREWFSKHVSAQRCNSKCVSEQTFYRLVQSFAVVLFECYQKDDFGPAKNLMTMCFTYYYIGKTLLSPTDFMEKPAAGIDSYLKTASSWLAGKKDIAERQLKNTSSKTENKWCHMSQEEKDDSLRFKENIAFGQLGTFTHNMLAFGLSRKFCNDFLKKQAVIGNLNEGAESSLNAT